MCAIAPICLRSALFCLAPALHAANILDMRRPVVIAGIAIAGFVAWVHVH